MCKTVINVRTSSTILSPTGNEPSGKLLLLGVLIVGSFVARVRSASVNDDGWVFKIFSAVFGVYLDIRYFGLCKH